MKLDYVPHRLPLWIYTRGRKDHPSMDEYSFWDFDYLSTKIEVFGLYGLTVKL